MGVPHASKISRGAKWVHVIIMRVDMCGPVGELNVSAGIPLSKMTAASRVRQVLSHITA